MSFLIDNLGTIIISIVLLIIAGSIVIRLIRNKKQGKTTCGCGCENCAMHSECHSNLNK